MSDLPPQGPGAELAPRILLVDDDERVRRSLSRGLRRAAIDVVTAGDGVSAKQILQEGGFDLVMSDIFMPLVDGMELLRYSRTLPSPPPFIMFSAYGSADVVAEAIRCGAADFLEKPVELQTLIDRVLSVVRQHRAQFESVVEGFVGSGGWYGRFVQTLKRIAQGDDTVLVQGETGTGKSLIARALWRFSPRVDAPFVAVNCAAIPEELLESELFGHVKGAFTGATATREGKIDQASGGVLLLDEVGELRSHLQAKLLHVLQERTFQPVGSNRDRKTDVRFIAATNRDLWQDVHAGRFRADLFHRLNVIRLYIPPLRERPADIAMLLDHFRRRWSQRKGLRPPHFEPAVVQRLARYHWPGNVRELENLVARAAAMLPEGTSVDQDFLEQALLLPADASDTVQEPAVGMPVEAAAPVSAGWPGPRDLLGKLSLDDALGRLERALLTEALATAGGNRSEAARLLGIKRTTLLAKLGRLGKGDRDPPG